MYQNRFKMLEENFKLFHNAFSPRKPTNLKLVGGIGVFSFFFSYFLTFNTIYI